MKKFLLSLTLLVASITSCKKQIIDSGGRSSAIPPIVTGYEILERGLKESKVVSTPIDTTTDMHLRKVHDKVITVQCKDNSTWVITYVFYRTMCSENTAAMVSVGSKIQLTREHQTFSDGSFGKDYYWAEVKE